MSTPETALSLDSIDRALEVVSQEQRPRARRRVPTPGLLQRSAVMLAVIALTPVVLMTISALLAVFIVKLVFALLTARREA